MTQTPERGPTLVVLDTSGGDLSYTLDRSPRAGDGFEFKNTGTNDLVVGGNGKLIDGAATLTVGPGEGAEIAYDGTQWHETSERSETENAITVTGANANDVLAFDGSKFVPTALGGFALSNPVTAAQGGTGTDLSGALDGEIPFFASGALTTDADLSYVLGTLRVGAGDSVSGAQIKVGDTAANAEISGTLPGGILPGSVTIADSSTPVQTIADAGSLLGILTGDIGSGGTNTINYVTGAYSFSFAGASTGPVTVNYERASIGAGGGIVAPYLTWDPAITGITPTLTLGSSDGSAVTYARLSVVAAAGVGGFDNRIDINGSDPVLTGMPSVRVGIDPDIESAFLVGGSNNFIQFWPSAEAARGVNTIGFTVSNFAPFVTLTDAGFFPDAAGDNAIDLGVVDGGAVYGTLRWRTGFFGTGKAAGVTIGSGVSVDATVNLLVDAPGILGNSYTVEVVAAAGADDPLSAAFVSPTLTVTLGKTGGVLDPTKNTATLVMGVINGLSCGITASLAGTGADSLTTESQLFFGGAESITTAGKFDAAGGGYLGTVLFPDLSDVAKDAFFVQYDHANLAYKLVDVATLGAIADPVPSANGGTGAALNAAGAGEIPFSDGATPAVFGTSAALTWVDGLVASSAAGVSGLFQTSDAAGGNIYATMVARANTAQTGALLEFQDVIGNPLGGFAMSPSGFYLFGSTNDIRPLNALLEIADKNGVYATDIFGITVTDPLTDPFPVLNAINVNIAGFSVFKVTNQGDVILSNIANGGKISTDNTGAAASGSIGSGTDGTVALVADTAGVVGNSFTVEVATWAPALDHAMTAAYTDSALLVKLGTDGAGVEDATKNTATLIAGAINTAAGGLTATASGTGATPLTAADIGGPTNLTGGAESVTSAGGFGFSGTGFYLPNLPATDPGIAGMLYHTAGAVMVSV